MQIAIIGAGITGLSAAYYLSKNGHKVMVFEKNDHPGGLVSGFKENDWDWTIENYYHHLFTSDNSLIKLIDQLGLSDKLFFTTPKSSVYYNSRISRFDSPLSLILFPELSIVDRIRTGVVTLYLKTTNNWLKLEGITAAEWLPKYFGNQAYKILWEPLLKSKFGQYADSVSMAWFWARIKKRSSKLGYLTGGFQVLIDKLIVEIKKNGGEIILNKDTDNIENLQKDFDKIIVTVSSEIFTRLSEKLPKNYRENLSELKMVGAISLVLTVKDKFLKDDTYWLNINEGGFPFVAVVEHTNFIDPVHYNNQCLLFIGGYYPYNHRYFTMKPEDILEEFLPFLNKINPKYNFKFEILNLKLVSNQYAQPIVPVNYSQIIPPYETPIPNVYLANMQQIYPYDRGVNYSIQLGEQIAKIIAP